MTLSTLLLRAPTSGLIYSILKRSQNSRSNVSVSLRLSMCLIPPEMAGNIIPAIATTNAMTAALCVLQAFKVLKGDFDKARMVFLERTGVRALNSDTLKPPNPNCPVCSVASSRLAVDPAQATLGDLVNGILRLQLGYGEEFSVNTQAGTVYDPDLEDNLPRKLSDLGISSDSFITVVDEDDESPRINFELIVTGRYVSPHLYWTQSC